LYESDASTLIHPLDTLFSEAGIKFMSGIVKAIHTEGRTVDIQSTSGTESSVGYDRLILAAGSSVVRPASVTGLREHAFDIDSLDAAIELEAHLKGLQSLPASSGRDTVVVCGAGFTGIEIAAELPKRLSHINGARVILVGNTDEVAPDFGNGPRSIIEQKLKDLGVEVKLGYGITAVDSDGVTLASGERIKTKTAIWTAGVKANSLTQQVPAPRDHLGRLYVDQYLRVSSVDSVVATGDTACAIADGKSQYALMSCQHANLLGRVSGHNAAAELLGEPLVPYVQAQYNCCLDLGSETALVAGGWKRDNVVISGAVAKRVKNYINRKLIYPPDDVQEAFMSADPITCHLGNSDQLFAHLLQATG
jgi:NADH dehydrogenase FAD-containing subunit